MWCMGFCIGSMPVCECGDQNEVHVDHCHIEKQNGAWCWTQRMAGPILAINSGLK